MFVDNIKVYLKAGNGGHGAISFRREKYVPAGGPDGGDGGRGGNVIVRVDPGSNTLLAYRYKRKFVAENGENGKGDKCHGRNGKDTVITVPPGTLLKEPDTGRIIFDMSTDREFVICKGGRGGWGNRHFATPTRQIPRFAKNGTEGEEKEVLLELKMIADVGLIGFPNVGKSSILSRVSSAKPKIADYHFTTLSPNLGVVSTGEGRGFVAADIPGLIEGASDGLGLGHEFLRHVDRCRLLLHVVDISEIEGRNCIEDMEKINYELERYSPELAERPQIVVANKCDMLPPDYDYTAFEEYVDKTYGQKPIYVSAVTGKGLDTLVATVRDELEKLPEITVYEPEVTSEEQIGFRANTTADTTVHRVNNTYYVEGDWLINLMGQINFSDYESLNYFQRSLQKNGVIDLLKEKGIKDGDTVNIYDFEFDFVF